MTIVRVKGFHIFKDRHGRLRCYHRKTGAPVDLAKAPIGSVEFLAECARIAELAKAKAAGKEKPGTLGLLIHDYRASPVFQDLSPRTRADYQGLFEYLRPIADTALVSFNRPLVVRIREKAASTLGHRRGNYVKAVLSILFSWAGSAAISPTIPHRASKTFAGKRARRKQTGPGAIKSATP
jgi:hypothetical protein